jgi:bifunctional DNA-binding transcriptional regulator/antitoxin component of YhaV-PrlF toxin-antitoxin module
MPVSTLNSRHQITIPTAGRDALGLRTVDRIQFLLDADGEVRVRKAPSRAARLSALEGSLAAEWDSPADDAAFRSL